MHPGVDAPQPLVGGNLPPERSPEGTLDIALLIDREGFAEQREQVRGCLARRAGEALLDTSQYQPQRGNDDVLLRVEIVSHHTRRVTGLARNPHNGSLVKTMLRDDAAGNERNLIAPLVVIHDLGHT